MTEMNDINNDMDLFEGLLSSDEISSLVDKLLFNNNLQPGDDSFNEPLPATFFDDLNSEDSSTTNGTNTLELTYISPAGQEHNQAILDQEPLVENPNTESIQVVIPKEANGNEDGIMYLMFPTLFNDVSGSLSVKQQPKANNRSRYSCDGARFLPDSRHHPLAINLPNLTSLVLDENATWGIVMTIVTTTNNPKNQIFVHANDIIYRTSDAKKIGYGCVFVPLEESDKRSGEKKFPRLSMIYKKCDDYTYDLTPFDPMTMFGITEKYASSNRRNGGNAARAKAFKKEYNLLSYKIIFHLACKLNNIVYVSGISCETETVDELKATTTATPPPAAGKRKASTSAENYSDEESSLDEQTSSSSKKLKSSTPPMTGLPVIYVSNIDINYNTDHGQ